MLKISRQFKSENTITDVKGIHFGGPAPIVIAGPCTVESGEQLLTIAQGVKKSGAHMLRGSAFKPRTSPYSFQGLGLEGLRLLKKASELTGLPVVSEIMSADYMDEFLEHVDMLQIGARNMQNFDLLKAVSKVKKPVLLKRGMSATMEEFLLAAEYLLDGGNEQVVLCERGIRTFETSTRNTLDLNTLALIKLTSHLPILVDPSHSAGRADLVPSLAKAALAAGADGLLIEVHHQPEKALCDGKQSLTLEAFEYFMQDYRR